MLRFLIDKVLAPLIEDEWREEALATIDELHAELLRREYKPFIASIITFIRVLSLVVYIPAFNFSGVGLIQKLRSARKTKVDNFSRYLALKRAEVRLKRAKALSIKLLRRRKALLHLSDDLRTEEALATIDEIFKLRLKDLHQEELAVFNVASSVGDRVENSTESRITINIPKIVDSVKIHG